ncbi:MAG: M20 family metallopeptidase [Rikenellaceae bacterium]
MATITPIEFRRHLHRYPELSFEEVATQRYISSALTSLGIEHRPIATTGVLAKLEGRGDLSRAVVLRADIDALPVVEATELPYSSQNEGVMHACGHDIHAAILYGTLARLAERGDFEGTIFGIFQPGEERNPGGASYVLAEEPFEGYDVRAVVGQHVEGQFEVGRLGFRSGKYMASSDEIRFYVRGTGGHGAMRHKIKDPVQAACAYLVELVALNKEDLVLSIGKVVADGATNVIPDSVYLEGTMRTFDEGERVATKVRIAEIAREIESRYDGITIEIDISHGFPCVVNDDTLTQLAIAEAATTYEVEALELRTTSEDFGFYTTRYPSLFYRLGAGVERGVANSVGAPHTSTFCPSEGAINIGIDFMSRMAIKIANNEK